MKTLLKSVAVAAVLSLTAGSAYADKIILKFGHVGKPGSL